MSVRDADYSVVLIQDAVATLRKYHVLKIDRAFISLRNQASLRTSEGSGSLD
jgi:hypothetical protein